MLQAFSLSYEPSPLVGDLFTNISFTLDWGECVALVGKNGTGKTKLMEILAGVTQPNTGRVVLEKGARIGYLPQDIDFHFTGSLRAFLCEHPDPAQEAAVAKACAKLGIHLSQLDQNYTSLSLGERVRAALARLLVTEPAVLLLDEPTNHLDIEAKTWLVQFLKSSRLTVLMVCHDREVVNQVADRVLELAQGNITEYTGGFDEMQHTKTQRELRQTEQYQRQLTEEQRLKNAAEKTLQKATRMTRKPTSRTYDPKAKAFYAGKEAKLDRRAKAIRVRAEQALEKRVEKPFEPDSVAIKFNARPLRHSDALTIRSLSKSFGAKQLFGNLNLTLEKGERIAIIGPNGCGKTTLFKLLLGEERPDSGEITWSPDAVPGFLSQDRASLPLDKTVLDALYPVGDAQTQFVRNLLARLRLRGDASHKPMKALSVGERTKVELVSILMTPVNVLLLDEPTNHLDVDSMEALEEALTHFPGCVLFTSHDQTFIRRTADRTLTL